MSKIRLSSKMDYKIVNAESKTAIMHIKSPESNMQTDGASFEGWSLILKSQGKVSSIELSFDEINWTGDFKNLCTDQCHYMRFLYRLYKFEQQMEWFTVAEKNKNVVEKFKDEFIKIKKVNNFPNSVSDYNEKKGLEHQIEKAFTCINESKQKIQELNIGYELYDQLPNGLFEDSVANKNRIFNTGYFDLWGIDNSSNLCIFELKEPKNKKVGLISELYFYANYAYDLFLQKDTFIVNKEFKKDYRGYDKLANSVISGINAYFLTNEMHPEIKKCTKEIEVLLNNNSKINYKFLTYSFNKGIWDENYFNKLKEYFKRGC